MTTQIFVNLPVKNLARSLAFFTQLGYAFDPQFTNEKAACMIVSDDIFVMLVTENFFQTLTPKVIANATTSTEVLLGISAKSREQIDEMVRQAVAAGATCVNEAQDHGFMYSHGFQDLDGHLWDLFYMEPGASCPG